MVVVIIVICSDAQAGGRAKRALSCHRQGDLPGVQPCAFTKNALETLVQVFLHLDFGSPVLVLYRGCPWEELERDFMGWLVLLVFGRCALLMGLLDGAG